jgi:hypothetical protein
MKDGETISVEYTTLPAQPAPDLQAELDATNRQVEILSDALAESRREVAALKAVQEPVFKPCSCRWKGEEQVQQCTLHAAHIEAIHEWAERAKTAEAKLKEKTNDQ